jgi:hypothetical protein
MDTRMLCEPGVGFGAQVTGQVICDYEEVSFGIISLDIAEQGDVAFRIARSSTPAQFLAVAQAQGPIDPGLLKPATIFQRRFNPMPIRGPSWRWGEASGQDRP